MNRYLKIGFFAVFVFGLGTFSGQMMGGRHEGPSQQAEADSAVPLRPVPQDPVALRAVPANETSVFPSADPEEFASFEEFVTAQNGDLGVLPVSGTREVSPEQQEATRQAIQLQFPEIDEVTLDIWTESYADLPPAELTMLLEQKRLIPRITPTLTNQEGSSPNAPDTTPGTVKSCLETNIANSSTCGYRKLEAITVATSATDVSVKTQAHRVFGQGKMVRSPDVLHMAFDTPTAWFVLQPGDILTRCGRFRRLDDGTVGVTLEGTDYHVEGTVNIPDAAESIRVNIDGTVSASVEGEPVECGRITVAVAENNDLLHTTNGVYFTLNGTSWKPATKVDYLFGHMLELSNVDIDHDAQMLQLLNSVETP